MKYDTNPNLMQDSIGEFPQNYHRLVLVGGFNPSEKLRNISQVGNLPQIWVNIFFPSPSKQPAEIKHI